MFASSIRRNQLAIAQMAYLAELPLPEHMLRLGGQNRLSTDRRLHSRQSCTSWQCVSVPIGTTQARRFAIDVYSHARQLSLLGALSSVPHLHISGDVVNASLDLTAHLDYSLNWLIFSEWQFTAGTTVLFPHCRLVKVVSTQELALLLTYYHQMNFLISRQVEFVVNERAQPRQTSKQSKNFCVLAN